MRVFPLVYSSSVCNTLALADLRRHCWSLALNRSHTTILELLTGAKKMAVSCKFGLRGRSEVIYKAGIIRLVVTLTLTTAPEERLVQPGAALAHA